MRKKEYVSYIIDGMCKGLLKMLFIFGDNSVFYTYELTSLYRKKEIIINRSNNNTPLF